MGTIHDTVLRIRQRVAALGTGNWLLAVSGGMDSMVLLDAAAETLDHDTLTVATFDHGTGPAATAAVELVAERALDLGLGCVSGTSRSRVRSEAAWREARWAFLNDVVGRLGATIVTAHTLDDQIETVFIRALRGAGPRGLAGLYATSAIARPLIETTQAEIAQYAAGDGTPYVTDPSNFDRRYLRNRVRLDLLPALEATTPGFGASLLQVAETASAWREQTEAFALTFPMMSDSPQRHSFERTRLRGYSAQSLGYIWPPLCARAGIVLDRRGTARLAEFTIKGETGQQIQLSGGVAVHMERRAITFRSTAPRG
ncbi:MAG: tRNA lysidine(34) synthetase TilS [Gemmatimonadaceae bacterium]